MSSSTDALADPRAYRPASYAPADVRQLDLLDDLAAAARRLPATFAAAQLRRLDVAGERLEGNVSPELVVDALALGWAA